MNCEAIRESLPQLAAGSLDSVRTVSAFDHIRACAGCRAELAQVTRLRRAALLSLSNALPPQRRDALWNEIAARVKTAPVNPLGIVATVTRATRQIWVACAEPIRPVIDTWTGTARSLHIPLDMLSQTILERG